jgi:hypothetical protein
MGGNKKRGFAADPMRSTFVGGKTADLKRYASISSP